MMIKYLYWVAYTICAMGFFLALTDGDISEALWVVSAFVGVLNADVNMPRYRGKS